ncbi:MAG TPA: GAF domain-containing SpoIIE family protein phosphatase [Actinocrinis sp.]|nr:GAF domain-containing SpoIIE family protein phosphatase [Actinocrinis sp.]
MDEQATRRDLLPSQGRGPAAPAAPAADPAQAAHAAALEAARTAEARRAADLAEARRGALAYLVEAGELLAGCLDPERTLALAVQLVVPKLAVWCAIHRLDETGRNRLALVWHADEELNDPLAEAVRSAPAAGGRSAPEHFTSGRAPVTQFTPGRFGPAPIVTGQRGPGQLTLEQFAADPRLSPGELLAVPLEARGRVLGTLTLATAAGVPFTPDAVELVWDLARRVALAYDSASLYSDRRATAHALQSSLLPADLPTVPHADIAVVYRPAGSDAAPADLRQDDLVGGDFYDVFEIRPPGPESGGCWGLAIGDVCGTGPQAAAVTGLARHALRLLAREGLRPAAVLDRLNRAILDEGDRGRFLTLCYMEVEPLQDGSLNLAIVCAGHPSPLVLRKDGTIEPAAANQPLLGVLAEGLDFYPDSLLLAPGETMLGFTDGASERRRNGVMLEPEGLADVLRDCRGRSAAGVAARVARTVEEYGDAPLSDDMAILVLRAADRPGPESS